MRLMKIESGFDNHRREEIPGKLDNFLSA
jgi:hypothetical protein